jgi:serine/threonine protein phosphatase PrpC
MPEQTEAVTINPVPERQVPSWTGRFVPYSIGNPGVAASRVVPKPDKRHWLRPDTVLDGLVIAGAEEDPVLELRAASVRGLAHREYCRVRQDAYAFRATPDGQYLLIGVADGVSAGELSHLAADWVVSSGTQALSRLLRTTAPDDLPWHSIFVDLASLITDRGSQTLARSGTAPEADSERLTGREVGEHMATTALFAVVDLCARPEGHTVHVMRVGDCSAWILRDEGDWVAMHPIKNADEQIHTSAVAALPAVSGGFSPPVRTTLSPGDALFLMSDGVGDPLADGIGEVGDFLANAWHRPPVDLDFAAQVGFARRSYDDDRTVVGVWPVARS